MPAISDPYFVHFTSRNHDRARRVRVRVRTVLYRGELTRALAEGADPTESHEFALRAEHLTSARSRRSLAHAMRRTLDESHRPPVARSRVVIIRRGAVLGAEDAIRSMIARLEPPSRFVPRAWLWRSGFSRTQTAVRSTTRPSLEHLNGKSALRRLRCHGLIARSPTSFASAYSPPLHYPAAIRCRWS